RESIVASGYSEGLFFPLPEPMIQGPATRVMSLRDGTKKMSKSDPSDLSRINMSDDKDTIARKIQKAKTDPEPLPSEEAGLENRPEADNLVGIYAALADTTKGKVLSEFGGSQFSAFKKQLAEVAVARVAPVNAEMQRLVGDPAEIDRILADGAARARTMAQPILAEIKNIVGFIQS
ncbi:MAG TPA: tryptophan--tRNA ligase, partial [Hyphomicrobiaceae bacterium]